VAAQRRGCHGDGTGARINSLAVVNPVNLLAVTLLSTPKHAADVRLLQKQIEHVQYLLAESPYVASIVTCDMPPGDVIEYVRKFDFVDIPAPIPLGDMIVRRGKAGGLAGLFPQQRAASAGPARLLACLVSHNQSLTRQRAGKRSRASTACCVRNCSCPGMRRNWMR
jgi:glycerol-3-phosphate O-acyltransferase